MDEGNAAIALEPSADEAGWVLRPYDAERDESGLMYFLGIAYTRTKAGWRAGASGAGRSDADRAQRVGMRGDGEEESLKRQAFLAAHAPIWRWLLENAEVTLAVDAANPGTDIWGWMVTSGPSVLHALGCKRSIVKAGLGPELLRDLAGERWNTHQVLTLEMPNLRPSAGSKYKSLDVVDLCRPYEWSLDPTWLVTRMVGR